MRGVLVPDPRRGPRARRRGNDSRLTDGLTAPGGDRARGAFYAPGYASARECLPFTRHLPDNPLGLVFDGRALQAMGCDALMKVHELRRQRVTLGPLHIVPIYVYTYEMDGETDQIYSAMNRAMRLHDDAAVAFWRPLIWHVDRALQQLPPYTGRLYRGIGVRFREREYQKGQRVVWAAFSSASATRAVAQEFVKGDDGTLFFLNSRAARAISKFSKFAPEDEVLFRPNTAFEITSTLLGTSDIGQIYASIDNIATLELPDAAHRSPSPDQPLKPSPRGSPRPLSAPGSGQVVVELPGQHLCSVLTHLSTMEEFLIEDVDWQTASGAVSLAYVRMAPGHSMPPRLPNPVDIDPEDTHERGSGPDGHVAEVSSADVVVQLSPSYADLCSGWAPSPAPVNGDMEGEGEQGDGTGERWDPVLKPPATLGGAPPL